jgi:subtilisin family serine protease
MPDRPRRIAPRRFPDSVDPRLERIYQQWLDRQPIHEPGVVRPPVRSAFRRLADGIGALRRMGRSSLEVDVLVELEPGVSKPGFLRGAAARESAGLFIGSVDIEAAPRLAALRGVRRVEVARGVGLRLAHSTPEIGADAAALATAFAPHPAYDGEGVIIGILDDGCDINHPNFKDAAGRSRILHLWRQNSITTPRSPQPYNYGQEYTKADIDAALLTPNPYGPIEGAPVADCHGAHVMDIAAGNGRAPGSTPGVAPKADIICVEVRPNDVDSEDFIGSSARLAQAAEYVFARADALGKPAVINLSLGTNGGPHDGTSLVDKTFAMLLTAPGRAIVVAAGNSFGQCSHASGKVDLERDRTLTWIADRGDKTQNELEAWYSGGPLDVFLTPPGGIEHGPFGVGVMGSFNLGSAKCYVIHSAGHPLNGLSHLDIFMNKPTMGPIPAGEWKVRLKALGAPAVFDAWIEREFKQVPGAKPTQFSTEDADSRRTLDSLACGAAPIIVGAYPSDAASPALADFTASGTTRDGRQKPDVCAPGERSASTGIFAAAARSTGLTTYSGTSQAAPHVTGVIALMMQKALEETPPRRLGIEDVRTALQQTARPLGPPMTWHARAGFGRVDAIGAIKQV